MMESRRRKFVVGNWKSNLTIDKLNNLVTNVINKVKFESDKVDVILSPVHIHIPIVQQKLQSNIQLSAQNCSATGMGAYTGEVNAEQVKDLGLNWVILGHLERRYLQGESNDLVAKKVKTALEKGLNVIICVGEKIEDKLQGNAMEIIREQLSAIQNILSKKQWNNIVIACEPGWSASPMKAATPEQVQEIVSDVRKILWDIDPNIGAQTRIIYGGSVNAKNCQHLIQQDDIDGFLVGAAALKEDFSTIVASCNQ